MVRLVAKGDNEYVDSNQPHKVAQVEGLVVLASLRIAIDTLLDLATEGGAATEAAVKQAVVLHELISDIRKETGELSIMLKAAEQRIMDL